MFGNVSEVTILVNLYGAAVFFMLLANFTKGLKWMILLIPFVSLFLRFNIVALNGVTLIFTTALLLSMMHSANAGKRLFARTSFNAPIIVFFAIVLFSYVWSLIFFKAPGYVYDWRAQGRGIKNWFDFILLFFIYVNSIREEDDMRDVIRLVMLGLGLEGLQVLREVLFTGHSRVAGHIGINDLGAFFATYSLLAIGFFIGSRRFRDRLVPGGVAAISMIDLVGTLSRGAFLGFWAGLLTLAFAGFRRLAVVLVVISLLIAVSVPFAETILPEKVYNRLFKDTFVVTEEEKELATLNTEVSKAPQISVNRLDSSASDRLIMWRAAREMFLESPIIGKGFGTFAMISLRYTTKYGIYDPKVAHNMFFQILAELGILGFGVFILLWVLFFRQGIRLLRAADAVESSFFHYLAVGYLGMTVAMCVANFFGNRFTNGGLTGYFWIVTAIVWQGTELCRRRRNAAIAEDEDEGDVSGELATTSGDMENRP